MIIEKEKFKYFIFIIFHFLLFYKIYSIYNRNPGHNVAPYVGCLIFYSAVIFKFYQFLSNNIIKESILILILLFVDQGIVVNHDTSGLSMMTDVTMTALYIYLIKILFFEKEI
jgi:hypothetical protein